MTDSPDNLVLTLLRDIRTGQDKLRDTLAEHTARLGRVEQSVAQLRRETADVHVILAEHSVRFDRMDARLERIEKRLGLVDA